MHLSPDEERAIRKEFDSLVNLEPAELRAWLKRPERRSAKLPARVVTRRRRVLLQSWAKAMT